MAGPKLFFVNGRARNSLQDQAPSITEQMNKHKNKQTNNKTNQTTYLLKTSSQIKIVGKVQKMKTLFYLYLHIWHTKDFSYIFLW